jgi:hypothetical protein
VEGYLRDTGEMISERGEDMRDMLTVIPMKVAITRGSLMDMEFIRGVATGNSMKVNGTWVLNKGKESGQMLRETAILASGSILK